VTNDLEGAASKTYNVEVAVLPVPPFVELTFPVVFTYVPEEEAVTVAVTVQLLFSATVPALSMMTLSPAVPVIVPPHWNVDTFAERVMPVGRVSIKAMPLKARLGLIFVMVKIRVDGLPATVGFGEKDFVIEGGATAFTVLEPVLFDSLASGTLLWVNRRRVSKAAR
jgi:hypothetical protein